jgi:ubiquinone/menaquinone biosynthesis C-methylase UbiE
VKNIPKPRFTFSLGRRHFTETPYVLPNDLKDAHRLDFQHFMLKALFKGNYLVPIKSPHTILDVAGGTGRWAMEMACQFPEAEVYYLDVVPPPEDYQKTGLYGLKGIPSNYRFLCHDMFTELPFAPETFDFVHMRMVFGAVPVSHWQPLINRLAKVTRKGGWTELVEGSTFRFPGPTPPPATTTLLNLLGDVCSRRGIDPTYGEHIGHFLQMAGFHQIHARAIPCLAGPKAGRLGIMIGKDCLSAFEGMGTILIEHQLISPDELAILIHQMGQEIEDGSIIWPLYQAIGRKERG